VITSGVSFTIGSTPITPVAEVAFGHYWYIDAVSPDFDVSAFVTINPLTILNTSTPSSLNTYTIIYVNSYLVYTIPITYTDAYIQVAMSVASGANKTCD